MPLSKTCRHTGFETGYRYADQGRGIVAPDDSGSHAKPSAKPILGSFEIVSRTAALSKSLSHSKPSKELQNSNISERQATLAKICEETAEPAKGGLLLGR